MSAVATTIEVRRARAAEAAASTKYPMLARLVLAVIAYGRVDGDSIVLDWSAAELSAALPDEAGYPVPPGRFISAVKAGARFQILGEDSTPTRLVLLPGGDPA